MTFLQTFTAPLILNSLLNQVVLFSFFVILCRTARFTLLVLTGTSIFRLVFFHSMELLFRLLHFNTIVFYLKLPPFVFSLWEMKDIQVFTMKMKRSSRWSRVPAPIVRAWKTLERPFTKRGQFCTRCTVFFLPTPFVASCPPLPNSTCIFLPLLFFF